MPVSTSSGWPASTSDRAWSRTTFGSRLRLAPRARGTMQNAHRCWQPSWTFKNARDRPLRRPAGATATMRARAMSDTWTRAATEARSPTEIWSARARSSRSASRCLSPLPTTRSTPSMPATSPGLVCAQQPVTTRVARGLTRAARLMVWRSDSSARAVTVHVLTTTTSAGSAKSTVRNPRASSEAWMSRVSTWLSRHPRVANDTVRAALNSAGPGARDRRGLAKLAAGRADILALAPPDRRRDPGVEQDRLEREDPCERRPPELGPLPVVERDQIDLGLDPAEQADQPLSVVDGVVDVLEHYVLEEHALA